MTQFSAFSFLSALDRLYFEHKYAYEMIAKPETSDVRPHDKKRLIEALNTMLPCCEQLQMDKTKSRINHFLGQLNQWGGELPFSFQIVESELRGLQNAITEEVNGRKFTFIPSEKIEYFEQDELFGKLVNKSFPSAKNEIKDAGNCLAADLNTAAIFHLMRVAETGLRALARRLAVKIKKMPLEYADWGKIIPEIEEKIKLKMPKSRGKKQSETLEFYRGAIGEFNAFKDVWRNNVMHARGSYDEKEAIRVFNHVRGFMQRLAAKISE